MLIILNVSILLIIYGMYILLFCNGYGSSHKKTLEMILAECNTLVFPKSHF